MHILPPYDPKFAQTCSFFGMKQIIICETCTLSMIYIKIMYYFGIQAKRLEMTLTLYNDTVSIADVKIFMATAWNYPRI
jgi:hypothetical protein